MLTSWSRSAWLAASVTFALFIVLMSTPADVETAERDGGRGHEYDEKREGNAGSEPGAA